MKENEKGKIIIRVPQETVEMLFISLSPDGNCVTTNQDQIIYYFYKNEKSLTEIACAKT